MTPSVTHRGFVSLATGRGIAYGYLRSPDMGMYMLLVLSRVMLVGLGGNNGSTLMGGILANKLGVTWMTKDGIKAPNYWGSLTQSSTCRLGNYMGEEAYAPFKSLLPMVDPNDIVLGGWDISSMNMAEAMERARVLDWELQRQLIPHMQDVVPLPAIYDSKFIAANQGSRADNIIKGSKKEQVEQVRADIRAFKEAQGLDKVVVLWSANTERQVTFGCFQSHPA